MNDKEEVQEQNALIQQLQNELELKNKCLSLISHDFKGMFTNILWILNAYKDEIISHDEFLSMLPELRQNAQINLNTINDTFEWINVQNETLVLQPKEIVVNDLITDLKEALQKEIKKKNITIKYNGEPNLVITGDKVILRFILKKLLENAIKYSYIDSQIEVETRKQAAFISICIKDKGMGICPERASTLFTLNRATYMGTENEKGAGLSLVIANDFVKMMNGEIKIYPNDDQVGTTVELRLPHFGVGREN